MACKAPENILNHVNSTQTARAPKPTLVPCRHSILIPKKLKRPALVQQDNSELPHDELRHFWLRETDDHVQVPSLRAESGIQRIPIRRPPAIPGECSCSDPSLYS
jgi:hypothetical protein